MHVRIIAIATALVLAVGLIALAGCQADGAGSAADGNVSSGQEQGQVRTVSGDEALQMMESESDYAIVDVRTPEEFAEGHIPDALNIPLDTIAGELVAELPDKDQLIMIYCRSGNRSATAASQLAAMGYTNVVDFGGIKSWPGEVLGG